MKTLLSLLLLVLIGGLGSCELLSNNEPKTELEKLPPITQEGKNTFGCLVNGKALVVTNTMEITAIYQGGVFQLGGGVENNVIDVDITINLEDPLNENMPYDLTNFPVHIAKYRNKEQSIICSYEFEETFSGSFLFSKIDRIKYIISGTFEFSAVTQDCDTVKITNGRFDVQYIP